MAPKFNNIFKESAMGVEVKALDDPESPLVGAFHEWDLQFAWKTQFLDLRT